MATNGKSKAVDDSPVAAQEVASAGTPQTTVEAAAAKKKKTTNQIMNSAVQKWWFAAIGLLLGLVSFGFGIAMALRAERLQKARAAAEQDLQKRTTEFTRIATDFVGAIDEQEARVRDNVDRLDRLQHYWVTALEDNQRITEQTYEGVRGLQQHLRSSSVLPPLATQIRAQPQQQPSPITQQSVPAVATRPIIGAQQVPNQSANITQPTISYIRTR